MIGRSRFSLSARRRVSADDPDPVRVIGWISIIIAALTHTSMNIYNMVRGKNYEQLKEAMSNYKELAESRKVVIAELHAGCDGPTGKTRLEFENERLAEKNCGNESCNRR
jgi:hypothetical protein